MKCYFIPLDDAYIVYRPLLPLAFIANAAMKTMIETDARTPEFASAWAWLDEVGFTAPDIPLAEQVAPPAPHTAVLLMTNACNLRCTYCYADAGAKPGKSMPVATGEALIRQAAANAIRDGATGFKVVFHGGGEPTMHWHALTELTRIARTQTLPCHISMATNGVMNAARLAFIIEHFDELSISFDGLAHVQDAQRPSAGGAGSHGAVMRTFRQLDEAGFRYGVRITARPEHFAEIPAAVAFIFDHTGTAGVQIEPAYPAARGAHGDGAVEQGHAFVEAFSRALDIGVARGRLVYYSGATPWRVTDRFCRAATDALVGTPEGELVGCFEVHDKSHARHSAYRLGAVAEGGALPDSALTQAFEAKERARKTTCETCHCFHHCAGDCSIQRPDGADTLSTRCNVNRAITADILMRMVAESGGVWRGAGAHKYPCGGPP